MPKKNRREIGTIQHSLAIKVYKYSEVNNYLGK